MASTSERHCELGCHCLGFISWKTYGGGGGAAAAEGSSAAVVMERELPRALVVYTRYWSPRVRVNLQRGATANVVMMVMMMVVAIKRVSSRLSDSNDRCNDSRRRWAASLAPVSETQSLIAAAGVADPALSRRLSLRGSGSTYSEDCSAKEDSVSDLSTA